MNWLGQHIVDFIARFRSDVYLEDLTTTTDTSVLVVDSNDKVCKNTSVGGDITSVVAGSGMTGGATTGDATLNVIGGDGITANADDIKVTPAQTTITSVLNDSLQIGTSETHLNFVDDGDINILVSGASQFHVQNGIIMPTETNDIDLGTVDLEFKNAWFDGTVTSDAFSGPLTGNADTATTAVTVTSGTQAAITTCANLTTVGTIATGTWNAGIIAEGKLQNQSGTNTGDEPDAADDTKGIVELATTAEATTGTDTARAVTAAGVTAHVDDRYQYVYMNYFAFADGTGGSSVMSGDFWVFSHDGRGSEYFGYSDTSDSVANEATTFTLPRQSQHKGIIMPYTGILQGVYGVMTSGSDNQGALSLWQYSPAWGVGGSAGVTATRRMYATGDLDGATSTWTGRPAKIYALGGTTANTDLPVAVTAGDALLPALVCPVDGETTDLKCNFTIVLKVKLPDL